MKVIKDRLIRLGIIGCGRIASKHFEGIEGLTDDIKLVSVCDVDTNKLDNLQIPNINKYTDIDAMLSNEDLDIVTIATPNGLHPEHIKKVANYGIDVITEKPMAIDLNIGLEVATFCKSKGIKLFVVHQNRFNNTIQALYQAYKDNRFGKIYMITSNVFWTRPQSYYDKEGNWHGSIDMDGGAYYTQASHYVDLMQWFANSRPRKIFANLKTLSRDIETEDSGLVNIEWENSILGSINLTMLTYPKNLEGSLTILGEKGTVKIGGVALNKIETWEFSDHIANDEEAFGSNYMTDSVYGNGHSQYYKDIVQDLRGNKKALLDSDEGIKSLEILEGIYLSNSLGMPVNYKSGVIQDESKILQA